MVTHLVPDILECKVKWALGSFTMNIVSGTDGIPADLFQIQKVDAVKMLHSICQQIGKLRSGHRTGKSQFSFQSQRRDPLQDSRLGNPMDRRPWQAIVHGITESDVTE